MSEFHVEKTETTIDAKDGTVEVLKKGVAKGFAKGFRDYIMRGPAFQEVDLVVNTGKYPEGHEQAGKWAVQIMLSPFKDENDAITMADRMESVLKGELRK